MIVPVIQNKLPDRAHKEFPKDIFKYSIQENQTLVSPRNIGIEFHVGFCFSVGKR